MYYNVQGAGEERVKPSPSSSTPATNWPKTNEEEEEKGRALISAHCTRHRHPALKVEGGREEEEEEEGGRKVDESSICLRRRTIPELKFASREKVETSPEEEERCRPVMPAGCSR